MRIPQFVDLQWGPKSLELFELTLSSPTLDVGQGRVPAEWERFGLLRKELGRAEVGESGSGHQQCKCAAECEMHFLCGLLFGGMSDGGTRPPGLTSL